MANKTISEFQSGDQVTAFLVIRKMTVKETRESNEIYLALELGDASGRIPAVLWENSVELARQLDVGAVVKIHARVSEYRDRLQLTLARIRPARESEFDASRLLPVVGKDRDILWQEFSDLIDSIQDPHLNNLLKVIFSDEVTKSGFIDAPGGKLWHHNYLGGLLEHTVNVTQAAVFLAQLYPAINRDLLVAGGLLHDIGKVASYEYKTFIDFTDEGRLIGHIVIGAQWVAQAIRKIDQFPKSLETELIHLILSHQGKLEHASPVVPMTLEGLILYYADEFDSKANAFLRIRKKEKTPGVRWSSYVPLTGQYYYFGGEEA